MNEDRLKEIAEKHRGSCGWDLRDVLAAISESFELGRKQGIPRELIEAVIEIIKQIHGEDFSLEAARNIQGD